MDFQFRICRLCEDYSWPSLFDSGSIEIASTVEQRRCGTTSSTQSAEAERRNARPTSLPFATSRSTASFYLLRLRKSQKLETRNPPTYHTATRK
eukprot:scaffold193485_cov32-Tisochrysis_lutea.AAC.10